MVIIRSKRLEQAAKHLSNEGEEKSNGDVASTLPLESLKDVQVCTTAGLTECKRVSNLKIE